MSLFAHVSSLLKIPETELPFGNPLAFEWQLVRSSGRRSISIEISKGIVTVRAPYFVAKAEIEKFVWEKSRWVQKKLAQQLVEVEAVPERIYVTGSLLPFLGYHLRLEVEQAPVSTVVESGGQLFISVSTRSRLSLEENVRRLVCSWYQQEALQMLTQKTDLMVRQLGLRPSVVTVKATRSKWGHCTTRGDIQYNWHILLAPETIVDYLVAHEVSHRIHHNHSPEFWQLVASLCPDYKKRRAWLKANGAQLVL
jgi:predicted metal-dependent hydrolase